MRNFLILTVTLLLSACGYKTAQLHEQQEIQKLVEANQPAIDACYQTALKHNPQLPSGMMTLRADQNNDGSLHSTRLIRGFAGSNEVFGCIAREVNSWKTQPPKTWGPVEVTFEFKNLGGVSKLVERDFGSIVKQNHQKINQCFGSLEGKVAVKFLRSKDGRIRNLENASSNLSMSPAYQCIAGELSQWQLAEVNEDTDMVWTFTSKRQDN